MGTAEDRRFMAIALGLARRGLGRVAPNPAVGCVLVRDGRILGRGWTQPGGRPHAETEALARAGDRARGATAYVSLEPCAHRGETAPCVDALIAAGVVRVVAAAVDPDSRTAGRAMARLEEAGVATTLGVLEQEAVELNRGFFLKTEHRRPLVTLKLATSLDGRIASRTGHSKWITGEEARRHAHLLRAQHDAILVGRGTFEADDPELTCRLDGLEERSPVRCVLSSSAGPAPIARAVATAAAVPLWWITAGAGGGPLPTGVERIAVDDRDGEGRPRIGAVLAALANRGVTRLLVEGGAAVAAAFVAAGAVDRLYLYRSGRLIGGDGLAVLGPLGVEEVDRDAPAFRFAATRPLGVDRLDVYVRVED